MGSYLSPISLPPSVLPELVSAGYDQVCIISSFSLYCWGNNDAGQLGIESTNVIGDGVNEMGVNLMPTDLGVGAEVTFVDSGDDSTCAILDWQNMKCWGNGYYGQLGYGDSSIRGSGAGEMGDYLPVVDFGSGQVPVEVHTSHYRTCVLSTFQDFKCFGAGYWGMLGTGDYYWRGNSANEMGDNLPFTYFGSGQYASSFSMGEIHTCVIIQSTAKVKCFGSNLYGEFGVGSKLDQGGKATTSGKYMKASMLGSNLGAMQVSAGQYFTCVLLDSYMIKCFGLNDKGQLGYGDIENRGDDANEMGDYLPYVSLGSGKTVTSVHLGKEHVCATLNDNSFKCFGNNEFGQLGSGDPKSRGNTTSQMGDYLMAVNLDGDMVQECFDFNPTSSPTNTYSPSLTTTFEPTQPTIAPTMRPTFDLPYVPINGSAIGTTQVEVAYGVTGFNYYYYLCDLNDLCFK